MFKNQAGFNDIVVAVIFGGIIGALFITGIFVWQEINYKDKRIVFVSKNETEDAECNKECEEIAVIGYELKPKWCNTDDCLFTRGESVLGVAKLVGYYTTNLNKGIEFSDGEWEQPEKNCDALTITGGNQKLIDSILPWALKGQIMYSSNDLDQPIVNFNLSNLNDENKSKLLNSTEDSPIEVVVLRTFDERGPLRTCFTQMVILDVR